MSGNLKASGQIVYRQASRLGSFFKIFLIGGILFLKFGHGERGGGLMRR